MRKFMVYSRRPPLSGKRGGPQTITTYYCRVAGNIRHTTPHPMLDTPGHGIRSRDGLCVFHLSQLQFATLSHLAETPPGVVCRRVDLIAATWPEEVLRADADSRLEWHIGCIRAIARKAGWPDSAICTIRGVGYRLDYDMLGHC